MTDRTFGQKIVRVSFNPSERADVKEAKRLVAELLDFVEGFIPQQTTVTSLEEQRLLNEAAKCFEEGCMWLVKGLTVEQGK